MTSRKVKHARALERREQFLEQERTRGLEALERARIQREWRRREKERLQEIQQHEADMDRLVSMMSMSMRRFPSDDEVHAFIQGDEETRLAILNNQYQGSK